MCLNKSCFQPIKSPQGVSDAETRSLSVCCPSFRRAAARRVVRPRPFLRVPHRQGDFHERSSSQPAVGGEENVQCMDHRRLFRLLAVAPALYPSKAGHFHLNEKCLSGRRAFSKGRKNQSVCGQLKAQSSKPGLAQS